MGLPVAYLTSEFAFKGDLQVSIVSPED